MQVYCNNQLIISQNDQLSLDDLIKDQGFENKETVVMVNKKPILQKDRTGIFLQNEDTIEIFTLVSGG